VVEPKPERRAPLTRLAQGLAAPGAGIVAAFVTSTAGLLFFARRMDIYGWLALGGTLLGVVSIIRLLLRSSPWSRKLAWMGAIAIALWMRYSLLQGRLIEESYRIYLRQHAAALDELNRRLDALPGDIRITASGFYAESANIEPAQLAELRALLVDAAAVVVEKDGERSHEKARWIYYELWGSLSVRYGVIHCPTTWPRAAFIGRLDDHWRFAVHCPYGATFCDRRLHNHSSFELATR
jgi:hypothetical protein